eukprot:Nitzschia sp. Nitz4//scaffold253_size28098//15359//17575//NITZ4_008142-RA/size28098-processed-gene-0.30-mRNA-1//-1//CDS//3329544303//1721//frame0
MVSNRDGNACPCNYWLCAIIFLCFVVSDAFIIFPMYSNVRTSFRAAPRYGPPIQPPPQSPPTGAESPRQKFRKFLDDAMEVCGTEFMPRLLSQNMETIMSLELHEGGDVINTFLEEAKNTSQGTYLRAKETTDLVLTFAEGVVEGMSKMQEMNQETLGKIVRTMTDPEKTAQTKEEELDRLMQTEKRNFTPSFLRHLEAECNRLANAPKVTPQSSHMLQIVQMIQSRVVEALGEDLGEAAVILGRLTGMKMPLFDILLLDMDGVLAEVSKSYRASIVATCHKYGATGVDFDLIGEWKARGGCNNDWKLSLDLINEDPNGQKGLTLDQVTETFEEFYQGVEGTPGLCDLESLIPTRETLLELRKRAQKVGIVTGRPRNDCIKFLKLHNMEDMIDACVCMEDGPPKPDPFPVVEVCRLLGVEPSEKVVLIGDTPDDIRAAIAAGCKGIGVATPEGAEEQEKMGKPFSSTKLCEAMKNCGADVLLPPGFADLVNYFPAK